MHRAAGDEGGKRWRGAGMQGEPFSPNVWFTRRMPAREMESVGLLMLSTRMMPQGGVR
jgi:hypothetical protein